VTQGSDAILERMMALHPKIIDLTLDRVWRLLNALGNPQDHLPPVVHIAGTNGKGSTLAMLRAGFEARGDMVHAYTSPHLVRFHERIYLAGRSIPENQLTQILDECYAANNGEEITYFEITTCAALLAFARTPAQHTLLEVGLGGRLDATNVVARPTLTIITPVSMDHQSYLGDTLAKIAEEKAGILKRGVPCVVGPQEDEALEVIEAKAERIGAPLYVHGQHWHAFEEAGRLVHQDEHGLIDLPLPVLPGAHQIQNAGAALAALRLLEAGEAAYDGAMTDAVWPARMQRLTEGPVAQMAPSCELWLDGGHNPAAGAALAAHLATLPKRSTHMICGMLNTKDVRGYLAPLAGAADSLTALSIPGEANTLSVGDTAAAARDAGFSRVGTAVDLSDALRMLNETAPGSRVLIGGSLYLAGHVLRENET